ncbi:iron-sulfur cluster assembly protein, partial [Halalkalibacter wakoensis]|uniref:iron-sulfur cluster assembly protein n=1 Tax=Halalkalibacter wakoensis TaxID=127891 RepID=UPI00054E9FD5
MNRESQVYEKLHLVNDPELDQSLTDLGFIDNILISGEKVEVVFRLPTYWCSPNFAFIMAEDIHHVVSELDWVEEVKVNLIDHCASDEINNGVINKKKFSESLEQFSSTGGNLEDLRHTFKIKAYYARQEKLIKYLLNSLEFSQEEIISLTIQQLKALSIPGEGQDLRARYLEKKGVFQHTSTLAIVTPEGKPLDIKGFSPYLLGIKRTRLSMEFNGHYCRGLLEARYNLPSTQQENFI